MVGLGSHHTNTLRHPRANAATTATTSTTKGMSKAGGCENTHHDGGSKQWYTLVKLDEYGGVGHVVSDEELRELEELILSEPDRAEASRDDVSSLSSGEESSEEDQAAAQQSEDTSAGLMPQIPQQQMPTYQKPGGPCDHCGAVDSPQWRRGPASKPMLCNACGTRYRRTNNLGPPTPMGRVGAAAAAAVQKKRSPPASPSSLNPAKKARCAPSMGGGLDRFTTGAVRA